MDKKYLEWDYDYKEKLLGKKISNNSIKNILLAKDKENYRDKYSDYVKHKQAKGHIENYSEVDTILKKVFNIDEKILLHKDIMNSFWYTYKFYLQLEYPAIFKPGGNLNNKLPLTKPKSSQLSKTYIGYPPHTTGGKSQYLNQKYIEYYNQYFQSLLSPFQKEIKEEQYPKILWVDFLRKNFEKFNKVHENKYLKDFAKLTHTIGNIVIVPKGFNSNRGNYDYWDYGLCYLKKSWYPTTSGWKKIIKDNFLEEYVCNSCGSVQPLWEKHLKSGNLLPKNTSQIDSFLITVNQRIENRGKRIMNTYNKLISPKTNL
ncbi:hypothetical protein [Holzapfeliella sp. JNUCC 80]